LNKRVLGLILILLGVSVWAIYAALKVSGISVNVGIALAVHLLFVIPGAFLAPGENFYGKIYKWFKPARNKSLSKEREQ
jgi:hypothetical protein